MKLTRSKKIIVRVADTECQVLHVIARCQGRKVSEALRELIRDQATQLGLWPSEAQYGRKL